MRRVIIVGVGNYLLGDEGVGIHVVSRIKECPLPEGVEVVDGGVGGLFLLDFLEKADKVIFIDAVLGGGKPGDIYIVKPEEVEKGLVKSLTSSHDVSLPLVIKVAREMGLLPETVIVGVEPKNYSEVTINLSREVESVIPKVIKAVLKLVDDC